MTKTSGPTLANFGPCISLIYRGPEPDPHRPGEVRHSLFVQDARNRWLAFQLPDSIFHELGLIPTGAKKTLSTMDSGAFFQDHTPLTEILPPGIEVYLKHFQAIETAEQRAIAAPKARFGFQYTPPSPEVIEAHANNDYQGEPWEMANDDEVVAAKKEWEQKQAAERHRLVQSPAEGSS